MILNILKFIYTWLAWAVFLSLCLWLIFEYFKKKEIRKKTVIFCLIVFLAVMAINLFLYSLLKYFDLKNSAGLSKYFLPPYSNYYYEMIQRMITDYIVAILTGLSFGLIFWLLFKASRGLLLDIQEVGLLAFGSLISSWPNVFIFLAFIFSLVVVCNLFLIIIRKKSLNDRFIITPFIPVAVILTIFLGDYLSIITGLYNIRF